MPRHSLSLAVVGAQHPNAKGPTRRFGLSLCKPGDQIELVPEPKNSHDEYAVAVFCHNIQLGYITAERSPWISRMLRNGIEIRAVFQQPTQYGGVIRVAFDGADPVLPVTREALPKDDYSEPDTVDTFWPDEEWPE